MTAMVSIVIPTRNRWDELRITLEGLHSLGGRAWDVIVVTNACEDGTDDMLRERFSWVRHLPLPVNRGMAAVNFGLEVATAPVLMVLDDDAVPVRGTVERAVARFRAEPELHALACAVEEKGRIVNAHWAPRTLCFVGCGAFFRTSTMQTIGGYSWDVTWLGNEKELVCRLIAAGHHVVFDPECVVVHRRSVLNRSWARSAYPHAWGTAYRVARYYSLWNVPLGLAVAASYHVSRAREAGGFGPTDLWTLLRGTAAGVWAGLRHRTRIPRSRRFEAARIWRAEMKRRGAFGRLSAALAPPDFWW